MTPAEKAVLDAAERWYEEGEKWCRDYGVPFTFEGMRSYFNPSDFRLVRAVRKLLKERS